MPLAAQQGLDPHLLPATVASCSASLVAIVGGLFASRIISVQQEAGQRRAEKARLQADYDRLREQRKLVDEDLLTVQAREWLARALPFLARAHAEISCATLLKHVPAERLEPELEPFLEKCKVVMRDTWGTLSQASDDDELLPHLWRSARTRYRLERADPFEDRVAAEAYKEAFLQRARSTSDTAQLQDPPVGGLSDPVAAALQGLTPAAQLKSELLRLDPELGFVRARLAGLDAATAPPRYTPLLASLALATAVGVLFPLALIAAQPRTIHWSIRLMLVLAAAVSFAGVLAALMLEARSSASSRSGTRGSAEPKDEGAGSTVRSTSGAIASR
ncbi:hypothetical protein [Blastococcus deserti]|uniref:Uncharacterized protein n=1 Tax=Blastococcus deserti TaxID=2259033 RepID=A0ABW4X654_9ACTN